jgi:hypothetical protein
MSGKRTVLVVVTVLFFVSAALAQTFTKITDVGNPIVAGVSSGYSGASWIDYDGDGDLDLFVNNGFLYRNDTGGNFTSVATDIGSGVFLATGNGNTWGDYDNDGDLDVFISSRNSFLYQNNGGSFTKITTGSIGNGFGNRGWACAWGDYNGDGYLDLAITHPAGFVPGGTTPNHLFLNDGPPNFTFTKITDSPIVMGTDSYTVGTWSDYDGDGDLDYFIGTGPANGTLQEDWLWGNLLSETDAAEFDQIETAPIATDLQDGQVWNWIDYDNDGDLDAYLTNWGGSMGGMVNRLYRHDGADFVSILTGSIVTDSDVSLSSVWGDFDNDGDLDCFVANDSGQSDRYYSNNGDGTFTSLTNALTENVTHRGASAGDYDDDGDLDLFADGPSGARSLFRNDTDNGNHWLKVKLTGIDSNRSAIGAKVRVKATIDGQTVWQLREVSAQNTFNGHNDLNPHFGLGDATSVEQLVVEWPSGGLQTLSLLNVDQTVEITEDTTTPPVPDGNAVPGQQLLADKAGSDVLVTWDSTQCPATAVNVYHGSIGDFTAFAGGDCDLPAIGSAVVSLPAGAWFIVTATDGLFTDGSWGRDSTGAARDVSGASVACPEITAHVVNDSCD